MGHQLFLFLYLPRLAEMHAANSCSYLSPSVLGNPIAVQAGKLNRCDKLFNSYSQEIINVGKDHAKSNILKLAANYILFVLLDLMGQTYSLSANFVIT